MRIMFFYTAFLFTLATNAHANLQQPRGQVTPRGLSLRQSCDSGYVECGSGCMQTGSTCCDASGGSCPTGYYCSGDGCCQNGEVCNGIVAGCTPGAKQCGFDCIPESEACESPTLSVPGFASSTAASGAVGASPTSGACSSQGEVPCGSLCMPAGASCCPNGLSHCNAPYYCDSSNQCSATAQSCQAIGQTSCGRGCMPIGSSCCPDGESHCDIGYTCEADDLCHNDVGSSSPTTYSSFGSSPTTYSSLSSSSTQTTGSPTTITGTAPSAVTSGPRSGAPQAVANILRITLTSFLVFLI